MCAKLKCCLNYEVDDYVEAGRRLPNSDIVLQTLDSDYFLFKRDILAGLLTYSTDKRMAANLETISAERAKEIIEMNKRGEKPESLHTEEHVREQREKAPVDLLAGDSITRFDKSKKKKKKKQQSAEGSRQSEDALQQNQDEQHSRNPEDRPRNNEERHHRHKRNRPRNEENN